MASAPSLGRLVSVPLRAVWAYESNDFTPWLAETENLTLLADTLNLGSLQVQGTEVPVGNFFIDILARDVDGGSVIIENQFGLTDHTHLGQILTYLAGQEGRATVIWIAESFREEHRATIDWLNSNTTAGFDFFAIEVEALKIGNSLPAPRFNIVSKPNDWSRDVVRVTRSTDDGTLDERARAYVNYWSGFADFLRDKRAAFKLNTPRREYLCGFGNIGRSGFHLNATAGFRDRKIRIEIYIQLPTAKRAFDLLQSDKEAIEKEFGAPLDWLRLDDKKGSCIAVSRTNADPSIEAQRVSQYEWYLDQMERFAQVFTDRIRALPLDDPPEADFTPDATALNPHYQGEEHK
jgi:hypothetical protein